MFVTTSAIVINRIKFKDNDLILKLYTKEHGLLTFISKKSTNRGKNKLNSFFQPLTILQISFLNNKKKEMLYFKSVDLKYNFRDSLTYPQPLYMALCEQAFFPAYQNHQKLN